MSNLSNVERGNLLEKAAEIGKVVWDAGTKLGNLFKSSSKPGKESGDCKADFESDSVTSCEATTSFQDDKPKSSSSPPRADLIADANDENDEDFQHTPELKTIGHIRRHRQGHLGRQAGSFGKHIVVSAGECEGDRLLHLDGNSFLFLIHISRLSKLDIAHTNITSSRELHTLFSAGDDNTLPKLGQIPHL